MANTGIHTLDTAQQAVEQWLSDLRGLLRITDHGRSYAVLRTVLHTLRDWITIDEAAQLSAQMPVLVRGIYYDGWNPSTETPRPHGKKAFAEKIDAAFVNDPLPDTDEAIAAVFKVLAKHIAAGEISDIKGSMTKDLQALWD